MTETKWTPGPLKIAIGKYDVRVESFDGRCTALTNDDWKTLDGRNPLHNIIGVDESIANARLYAAAPDLYVAAKESRTLLNVFIGPDDTLGQSILTMLDNAMRKARGE